MSPWILPPPRVFLNFILILVLAPNQQRKIDTFEGDTLKPGGLIFPSFMEPKLENIRTTGPIQRPSCHSTSTWPWCRPGRLPRGLQTVEGLFDPPNFMLRNHSACARILGGHAMNVPSPRLGANKNADLTSIPVAVQPLEAADLIVVLIHAPSIPAA